MSVVFNLPYLFKYICLLFLSDCIKSEECDSTLIYIDVNTKSNERVLARAAWGLLNSTDHFTNELLTNSLSNVLTMVK